MVHGRTIKGNNGENTFMQFEVRLSIIAAATAQEKDIIDEYHTLLRLLGLEHN